MVDELSRPDADEIDAHGGSVDVLSSNGGGMTFTVRQPPHLG